MPPRQPGRALLALAGLLLVVLVIGIGAVVVTGGPSETPQPSPTASPSPTPTATPSPRPSPTPSATPSPTPAPSPAAVCPMDGEPLADPALGTRPAILVQIENHPIPRPPSGLNYADLVIEAPVEGDTTRFMSVFLCDEPVGVDVGPVRSLRFFNVDLWQQLHPVTFAFGAATWTLDSMNAAGAVYLNGLTSGYGFFYRAGPYAAPHNVFFDVDGARAELESGSLTYLAAAAGTPRGPFAFDPAVTLPGGGRAVSSIGLQTASFWVFGWEWDAASGRWLRTDAGAANFDALTGARIDARSVVVQQVRQEVTQYTDPGGYPSRYQFLTGEGTGVLYVDGQAWDVRWSRPSADDLTTWTYEDSGEPMILPPGRVWWEIIPVASTITER